MASIQKNEQVVHDPILVQQTIQKLNIYNNGRIFNENYPGPILEEVQFMVANSLLNMKRKADGALPDRERLEFTIRSLQHLAQQPHNRAGKMDEGMKAHLVPVQYHNKCPQWFSRCKLDYEYFAVPTIHPLTGREVHGLYRTLPRTDIQIFEEAKGLRNSGSIPTTELEIAREEKAQSIFKCHHPVTPVEELYNMLAAAHGPEHQGRDNMYAKLTTTSTKSFSKEMCVEFIKICRDPGCIQKRLESAKAVNKRNAKPRKKAETKTERFGLQEGRVTRRRRNARNVGQGTASPPNVANPDNPDAVISPGTVNTPSTVITTGAVNTPDTVITPGAIANPANPVLLTSNTMATPLQGEAVQFQQQMPMEQNQYNGFGDINYVNYQYNNGQAWDQSWDAQNAPIQGFQANPEFTLLDLPANEFLNWANNVPAEGQLDAPLPEADPNFFLGDAAMQGVQFESQNMAPIIYDHMQAQQLQQALQPQIPQLPQLPQAQQYQQYQQPQQADAALEAMFIAPLFANEIPNFEDNSLDDFMDEYINFDPEL